MNLLLYLNRDWDRNGAASSQLWSTDMHPVRGASDPTGQPDAAVQHLRALLPRAPGPVARLPDRRVPPLIALYYFTEEADPLTRSTDYRARPGDG